MTRYKDIKNVTMEVKIEQNKMFYFTIISQIKVHYELNYLEQNNL